MKIFNKLIKKKKEIDYGAVPDDGIKVFNNSIDSNGNVKNSIIEKNLLLQLNNNCHEKAKYFKRLMP